MPDLGVVRELDQILDHFLAGVVCGVGLARDHQLDGVFGVQQQGLQTGRVPEHEREPLVGGHTPCESDGEDIGGPVRSRSSRVRHRQRRASSMRPGAGVERLL